MLLAALTSSAVARLEGHARRAAPTTTTVTTLITITACPCTSTSTPVYALLEAVTPTSTPVLTTSTLTPTPTPESTSTTATPTPETTLSTSTLTLEPTTSTSTPVPTTSAQPSTSSIVSTTSTTAIATSSSSGASADWTSVPSSGTYSTSGFGGVTNSTGSGDTYVGNVGSPYGSNIIEVESSEASSYKYVVRFQGSNTDDWTVVIWNKYGDDGKMDGWYGNACKSFTLAAGETKYYAFDTDTQGGFAAAKGSTIPTDDYGGYASTWGEFDFGSSINSGWSGFDVSAIQAQNADLTVQGMKICSALDDGTCSYITTGASTVYNAYTSDLADEGGIGGNLSAGAVRLAVTIDYDE